MESGSGDGSSAFTATNDDLPMEAELLKRAWRNEKAAPQILQFDADLVQRSRELIKLMVEKCYY